LKPHFEEVVRRHWSRIFHFLLQSVRDTGVAEDLTQDCFRNAFKGWNRFRGDSSAITWLTQIAMNILRDYADNKAVQFWRKAVYVDPMSVSDWRSEPNRSPQASLLRKEQLQRIWNAVSLVSPQQRVAFVFRFADDMNVHEIADVMGITEGAVKVHLARAVRAIREAMLISNSEKVAISQRM
jgi:RNA polymerase sigma-70 factor, ECF subfamily